MLAALSQIAAAFPGVEVPYEDLLPLQFRRGGRTRDGTTDCLGILLEVYRRAGILLPDPEKGYGVEEFYRLFDRIEPPVGLFDVLLLKSNGGEHLYTVIRPGMAISARSQLGVSLTPTKRLLSRPGIELYRVRPGILPQL